jgi:hypothetical protein
MPADPSARPPTKVELAKLIGPSTVTFRPNSGKLYQVFFLGVEMGQVDQITPTSWGYFAGGRDNTFPSLQKAAEARCKLMLRQNTYQFLPKLQKAWQELEERELTYA